MSDLSLSALKDCRNLLKYHQTSQISFQMVAMVCTVLINLSLNKIAGQRFIYHIPVNMNTEQMVFCIHQP